MKSGGFKVSDMSDKSGEDIKLAMIGDTGAGKSTFAASLYRGNGSQAFEIKASSETSEELNEIYESIKSTCTTPATQGNKPKTLNMDLSRAGRSVNFSFKDYPGELGRTHPDNLVNEIVGDVDGVLLLFNPRTEVDKTAECDNRVSWVNDVVDELAKRKSVKFVAVVTVAEDVRKVMEKSNKDRYECFKGKVLSHLRNSTRFGESESYKEFAVTSYDANNDPDLRFKDSNAAEPVIWLIDKIENARKVEAKPHASPQTRKTTWIIGAIVILTAVVISSMLRSSRGQEGSTHSMPSLETALDKEIGLLLKGAVTVKSPESGVVAIKNWFRDYDALKKKIGDRSLEGWKAVKDGLPEITDCCLEQAVEKEQNRAEISRVLEASLTPVDYDRWKTRLDEAVGKKEAECCLRVQQFINGELASSRDTIDAAGRLDNFYSDNGNIPGMFDAVRVVHERVGRDFKEICEGLDKLVPSDAESRFRRLKELAAKVAKSKALSRSCWKKFANDCWERGKLGDGVNGAFAQEYEITKIEAQIIYSKFPFNFRGVEFKFFGTEMNPNANEEVVFTGSGNRRLKKEDNSNYVTIWEGKQSLHASPWRRTQLKVVVTDVNIINKTAECVLKFSRGSGMRIDPDGFYYSYVDLNTQRKTGDKNPRVYIRVCVKGNGEDLLSLLPADERLEPL